MFEKKKFKINFKKINSDFKKLKNEREIFNSLNNNIEEDTTFKIDEFELELMNISKKLDENIHKFTSNEIKSKQSIFDDGTAGKILINQFIELKKNLEIRILKLIQMNIMFFLGMLK